MIEFIKRPIEWIAALLLLGGWFGLTTMFVSLKVSAIALAILLVAVAAGTNEYMRSKRRRKTGRR